MKCEKCGADACYMVAVDGGIGATFKNYVGTYAGRCKKCVDEKSVPKTSRTKTARPGSPYQRLRNAV